jgi:hypothetical protein
MQRNLFVLVTYCSYMRTGDLCKSAVNSGLSGLVTRGRIRRVRSPRLRRLPGPPGLEQSRRSRRNMRKGTPVSAFSCEEMRRIANARWLSQLPKSYVEREEYMPRANSTPKFRQHGEPMGDFNCGWSAVSLLSALVLARQLPAPRAIDVVGRDQSDLSSRSGVRSVVVLHPHHEHT